MSGPEKDVGPSFLDFARSFMASWWLHSAARTRETDTYALLSLIPAFVKNLPGKPADEELRAVLRDYALLPEGRRGDLAADYLPMLRRMEAASLPLATPQEPRIVRTALDAVTLTFDDKVASANSVRWKRSVLHHLIETAVELRELPSNSLNTIKWKLPEATDAVDPRTVVNPAQAQALLAVLPSIGWTRAPRMAAMFTCMYYAALWPEEASALGRQNCELPEQG
ncbi:hypothetical protein Aros01_08448 [Streptosporangium roseum]